MKKDIVDIVIEKDFADLTAEERSELSEFCQTESEYLQLKNVFIGIDNMEVEQLQPRKETKQRLDQLFDETYPKAGAVWYNTVFATIVPKDKPLYRQPLVQIAAVVVLLLLAIPLFNTNMEGDTTQLAHTETKSEEKVDQFDVAEVKSGELTTEAESSVEDPSVFNGQESMNSLAEERTETVNPGTFGWSDGDAWAEMDETVMAGTTAPVSSVHPDGVFVGDISSNEEVAYSLPASESEDLLDLLTTTF